MSDIVLQAELLNQFRHDTLNSMRTLLEEERNKSAFKWMTNEAAMELLDTSKRTMQNWRDDGTLGFSQIGHKIYYSHEEVDNMLQRHYKKPFKATA